MSSRRTIILIVALLMSGVSAFGILRYVQGVEETAEAEQVTGTYWAVKEEIPKGTDIARVVNEQMLYQVTVPIEDMPDTAVLDPATELSGRVAITNLPRATPILSGLFLAADVIATGVTERLAEKEMVSVTVAVDQIHAAAYQVEPGDFVNILSVIPVVDDNEPAFTTLSEEQFLELTEDGEFLGSEDLLNFIAYDRNRDGVLPFVNDVRYVYQNVEVLAIDRELTPQLGDAVQEEGVEAPATNQGLITFAVPPEAVQIILSLGSDQIYLSLVPHDYVPQSYLPVDIGLNNFPGELEDQLTPYGPDGIETDAVVETK